MLLNNKKIIEQIIKGLSMKDKNSYLKYLADDITWNIVGLPAIKGKSEFLIAVKNLELENFPSSNVKNIIAEGEFVVVESNGGNFNNSFCDIYRLKEKKILELTSYIIDTSINDKL